MLAAAPRAEQAEFSRRPSAPKTRMAMPWWCGWGGPAPSAGGWRRRAPLVNDPRVDDND